MASGYPSGFFAGFLISSRLGSSPTLVEPSFFLSVLVAPLRFRRLLWRSAGFLPTFWRHPGLLEAILYRFRSLGGGQWRASLGGQSMGRPCWVGDARETAESILREIWAAKPFGIPAEVPRRQEAQVESWVYLNSPPSKLQGTKHQSLRGFQIAACILNAYVGPSPTPPSFVQRAQQGSF